MLCLWLILLSMLRKCIKTGTDYLRLNILWVDCCWIIVFTSSDHRYCITVCIYIYDPTTYYNIYALSIHYDSQSVKSHRSLMQLLILLSTDFATDLPTSFHVSYCTYFKHFMFLVYHMQMITAEWNWKRLQELRTLTTSMPAIWT